jgi:hypothetical protein
MNHAIKHFGFSLTSIFFQIWWIIYLLFGHVVLVEEPLTVTNILGSGTEKILVTAGGSSTNILFQNSQFQNRQFQNSQFQNSNSRFDLM